MRCSASTRLSAEFGLYGGGVVRFRQPLNDDATELVPVRDASTVLIIRRVPTFEVLMVQRARASKFGPGAWVFPGGSVDTVDIAGAGPPERCLPANLCSTLNPGVVEAAIRETREEAGVALEPESLRLVGRFVTPQGPVRRFDTFFFLAELPDDQDAVIDEHEIVSQEWVPLESAARLWKDPEFSMMAATYRILSCLARSSSAEQAMDNARANEEQHTLRVIDPDEEYRVVLPGDDGYAHADLTLSHGWVSF